MSAAMKRARMPEQNPGRLEVWRPGRGLEIVVEVRKAILVKVVRIIKKVVVVAVRR